ncbi:hypothetical protein CEE45_00700 [Candidatus Heimdallarchaeota archaeon B3_Heim]|nr:MAG: hypothetical protein CEE45_00700 [Candidatus Heimdallarchaeota archaeon B3_Heim]
MTSIDPLTNPMNLLVSIVLTLTPLIVLFIPYLYTRRKSENFLAIIYNRAYIGFVVFYIAYFIFPSILNSFVPDPNQFIDQEYYPIAGTSGWTTLWDSESVITQGAISAPIPLLIKYLFGHIANSIVIYLSYPIVILAFVFGISPILSMTILFYQTWTEKRNEISPIKKLIKRNKNEISQLRKQLKKAGESEAYEKNVALTEFEAENKDLENQLSEVRSISRRFQEIQFELETSPFHEVMKRVKAKNWENERELLKVLIAILPITLFLLMTILQLLGETENPSLLQGTSMGWFLEIYFAYIATLVFSIYLIKASHLSRKGKFLGNQLYVTMVQSLSTVGAFMSGLAVILFLVQYFDQIFVVSYFIVYFIMVSLFFVLFLDIFEPFSIYLLLKLIESFKTIKITTARFNRINIAKGTVSGILVGFLLSVGFLTYLVIVKNIFTNFDTVQYATFFWLTQNYASFLLSATLVLVIRRWNWSVIGTSIVTYLSILSVSLFLFGWYNEGWYTILGFSVGDVYPNYQNEILVYPFLQATSVLGYIDLNWLTAVWKGGTFGGYQFILPELRQIPVIWQGSGGQFLQILSIPFNLFHPLAVILVYGGILFLAGKQFHVRTQKGEEKTQYKSIFSDVTRLPSVGELEKKADILLIAATPSKDEDTEKLVSKAWMNSEKGEVIRNAITGHMLTISQLTENIGISISEVHSILDEVTYDAEVSFSQIITLWHREFSYSFEEATIDSLHVMMLDGRAVLSHTFAEESQVEPALVAGLFSAITSFAKEAVRSEQLLKTIDHGDVVLTIEYANWVFAAIFADSTSTELRKKLGEFLNDFETRHKKTLPKWLGDLDAFAGETNTIKDLFPGA